MQSEIERKSTYTQARITHILRPIRAYVRAKERGRTALRKGQSETKEKTGSMKQIQVLECERIRISLL